MKLVHTAATAAATALTAAALGVGLAAPAEAAIVNNRFERSCNVFGSCGSFRQVNGAYVASVGSTCVSNSWNGSSEYMLPPGRRC